jgi:hypothetical protein
MSTSLKNLDLQKDALERSQKTDFDKINANLRNFKEQSKITITDAMRKLDNIFAITDQTLPPYESSLSANNPALKSQIRSDFYVLNSEIDSMQSMSDTRLSKYFKDLGDLFSLASRAVDASLPSETLPQSSQA